MSLQPKPRLTPEDYLALERSADFKSEYFNGEIFANVWYSDRIARIDPENGRVNGWLDLAPLRPREVRNNREAALNGIAWDSENRRLFVTGKNWPTLYEIAF